MEFLGLEYIIQIILGNWMMIVLLSVLLFLYHHYTKTYDHFREMGVPFLKPTIAIGNIGPRLLLKISFHDFNIQVYKHFDGLPYGGYFEGRRPLLMIRDPELLKAVMIKDFDHFTDRNSLDTNAPLYMKKMLINLKGKEWKSVRAILTPTFSSGKLRGMENLLQQCGRQMVEFLKVRPEGDKDIEMKEFTGRYTLEVIGSCAFGLDCDSLKDPNAEFVKMAAKFTDIPLSHRALFFFVLMLCPPALKYIPVSMLNPTSISHLRDVVVSTKAEREKDPSKRRNDFMQLVVDAARKEALDDSGERVMTDVVIQGQAILFLIAGFETSSTLLSFACATLATMPELQERLRKNILEAAEKNGKDCTYDLVNEIPLLDQVLLETLRMYPPVSRIDRMCTKPYNLPGTNLKINVGDVLVIPIAGILQDPEHYPDPEVFDPERFSAEEKNKRPSEIYLPFGMGPRNCIGLRFALMTAKFYLFYLLRDFKLSPCEKTQIPFTFDRRAMLLKAEKGAWIKIEPLDVRQ